MKRKLRLLLFILPAVCPTLAPSPAAGSTGGLIAPIAACPAQRSLSAPVAVEERAMRCMTEYARRMDGLGELTETGDLDRSTRDKDRDILRCDSFSHFACDRDFTYWMRRTGYISTPCWRVGENLAWGVGALGTARSIFRAWMRSPDHRANILGDFEEFGVSLQAGHLGGQPLVQVWATHFGAHCASSAGQ